MAKIALISDVHANLPALQAVIKELEIERPDNWICLGDIVGYGPNPAECLDLIRSKEMKCVLGNHDAGVTGKLSLKHFRNPNRHLIELSKKMLSSEQLNWLAELPLIIEDADESWVAVHSSPENPQKWEYLNSAFRVRQILKSIPHQFCFAGHTHRAGVVSEIIGLNKLKDGHKFFINPGSVGQSRDGDARASGGVLDLDNFTYKNIRVSYSLNPVILGLEKLGFSTREAETLIKPRLG